MYPEHSKIIYKFLEIIKDFKTTELYVKEERRRLDCPWSDNDCKEGPDTCRCIVLSIRCFQIYNLISY